jgi:hypothetical protein
VGKESGRGVKGERTKRERRAKGEGKESEEREWKKTESRVKGEGKESKRSGTGERKES